MKLHLLSTLGAVAATVALGITGSASASSVGFPSTTNGYAFWDSFTGFSFSNVPPGTFNASLFNTNISSAMLGGMIIPGAPGDNRLYAFGNAFDLTVAGSFNADVQDFTLRMKFTTPSVGTTSEFFALESDLGVTPDPVIISSNVVGSNTFHVVEWTWENVNKQNGDTFSINAQSAADHVSLDAVQVVPEPTTGTFLALGAAIMVGLSRRNKAQV